MIFNGVCHNWRYDVTVVFTIYTYMQCGDEIGSNKVLSIYNTKCASIGDAKYKACLAQCFYRRLQVTKFISICHELCLYVVGINLCTSTSIALFYCTVV